jgi:hypothetical protein
MARQGSVQRFVGIALVLLTSFFLATMPSAVAKSRKSKPAEPIVAVVGHVALSGPPAVHMFVQEHGRQQYLLIEQASKEGFTIVDVTKPSQAVIVKQVAWPNQASNGKLQPVKAGLVLSSASENNSGAAAGSSSTESLNLLDLRDPANPKTIQGFTGVTTVLLDENRSLLYVTNAEGLWILKYKQEEPASNPYGCPADGISTDPNCSN